jgi:hypothetical protein
MLPTGRYPAAPLFPSMPLLGRVREFWMLGHKTHTI